MLRRLHGWGLIAIAAAGPLVSGIPAQADVVVGAAIWTCENEGTDQAAARLDVTKLSNVDVEEHGVPLSAADEPFSCDLPWGQLRIEVIEYYSPRDNMTCGAAEVWGLKVTANGHVLHDIPADSARACHLDHFNPFQGWVEADAEQVVVCRAPQDGSDHDCQTVVASDF